MVLHYFSAVGIDKISALHPIVKAHVGSIERRVGLEHRRYLVETLLPCLAVDFHLVKVVRLFVVNLSLGIRETRSLVLVLCACGSLAACLFISSHSIFVAAECRIPYIGSDTFCGIVVERNGNGLCRASVAALHALRVVLEVVESLVAQANLWRYETLAFLLVCLCRTKTAGNDMAIHVFSPITHKVRLLWLFLQLLEVIFQLVF